jgi:hypothetical protein
VPIICSSPHTTLPQYPGCELGPAYILVSSSTPLLRSLTIGGSFALCPGVIELADGVTLTAEIITLIAPSRLRLGFNSKVVATSSFTSEAGSWIEGLGTIQAPNATVHGLVTPGFASGSVFACSLCFPNARTLMYFGDLKFTGNTTMGSQSLIFIPVNRPELFLQPALRTNIGANWSSVSFESITLDNAKLQLDLPLNALGFPITQPPSTIFTWSVKFSLIRLDLIVENLCLTLNALCASPCVSRVICPSEQDSVQTCAAPQSDSSLSILFGTASCQPPSVSTVCSPACVHGICNAQFLFCVCDPNWNGTACDNAELVVGPAPVSENRLNTGAIVGISMGCVAFGEFKSFVQVIRIVQEFSLLFP